jgi:hypothetical protein
LSLICFFITTLFIDNFLGRVKVMVDYINNYLMNKARCDGFEGISSTFLITSLLIKNWLYFLPRKLLKWGKTNDHYYYFSNVKNSIINKGTSFFEKSVTLTLPKFLGLLFIKKWRLAA